MPYATPAQVIAEFGLREVTQLLADEQELLTEQLLLGAIAVAAGGAWTGSPSAAEIAAAQAALARLLRKIETVGNYMDGYLRSAITLPVSALDANLGTLNECCMALVRCGLADDTDNATERMDECCNKHRAWLKDVARGVVSLVNAAGAELPSGAKVRTGQAASNYNWGGYPPGWGGGL